MSRRHKTWDTTIVPQPEYGSTNAAIAEPASLDGTSMEGLESESEVVLQHKFQMEAGATPFKQFEQW